MTCSRNFRRIVQASCLGLIGALTVVGCGGSESTPPKDAGGDIGGGGATGKPNINASTATVVLGTVDVGTTSTPQTVTITNTGSAGTVTVTPTGVGISASGCGGTLAAGGNCIISITAAPTAVGPIVGSIAVVAAGGNAVSISVTGTATLPGNFTVSPTAVDLGTLILGATAKATVTVSSTVALSGLSAGVTGADLKLDPASTCTASLAAGTPCQVVATFTAATAGAAVGDAIVISQGGVTKSIPVTAIVVAPVKLAATPATASLTAQPGQVSSSLDISVGNVGGVTTGAITVVLGGANAADFGIVSDKCSIVTLAPGAYCTVTVNYKPAATVTAAEAATLTVASGTASAAVALAGIPNISSISIAGGPALGSVAPGVSGAEVVFTVSNSATGASTGALAVSVNSALVTVSSNTCATKATLAAGDSCTVGLKLAPPAGTPAQAISGLLTVAGATAGKASASFTGAVVTPAGLTATPTSITFGSVPQNQQSAAKTVTVTNIGAVATGTLAVTLAGTGAAQVAITSNTCTGTLAPAATCTFSVQYSPTDQTGVNGTVTVGDGLASVVVPMVGTGLPPSILTVAPQQLDFGNVVLGTTATSFTGTAGTNVGPGSSVVVSLTNTTTGSGDLSTVISGDAKADYAVSATAGTCVTMKSIQPGQSCTYVIAFTPSAVGVRSASLTISSTNGGNYIVSLTGKAFPLVDLVANDATTTAPVKTGLDFGMWPNGSADTATDATVGITNGSHSFRMIVRGATNPAATSTVSSVQLAAGTPPDFVFSDSTTNRCSGATLGLGANGATGTAPTGWTSGVVTGDVATAIWYCDFHVQFYPQSGKSATPKTATLTASASAGGEAVLSPTGIATGPLTISPSSYAFSTPVTVGLNLTLSLAGNSEVFTLTNHGPGSQGPLTVALSNTTDFAAIVDGCSGQTITSGNTCTVTVGFAPTTTGTKTTTLTVSSGTESSSSTITGTASQPGAITLSPASTATSRVDLGSVAQQSVGSWVTFTITNPANGAPTGLLTYSTSGEFEIASPTLDSNYTYPSTACGDSGSKLLNPTQSCTIQVRFHPANTNSLGARTGSFTVTDPASSTTITGYVKGTSTAQVTLGGSDVSLNSSSQQVLAFGTVSTSSGASGSATKTVTVTNNGTAITLNAITWPSASFSFATSGTTCSVNSSGVLSLLANASCQLAITFTGSSGTVGNVASSTHISFAKSATSVSADLYFSGTVAGPATIERYGFADYVAGSPVELGAAAISASTGIVTLTFTNNGGVPATAIQASFAANGSLVGFADFVVASENQGTCLSVGSLDPGKTCTVNVRCTPSAAGARDATMTLFGLGVTGTTVNLHARGITTSNAVYAVPLAGGSDSIKSFGSTSPFTGSTVPAANMASFTLHNNSTTDDITFASGFVVALPSGTGWTADSHGSSSDDFSITVPTDGTGCGTTVLHNGGTCVFNVVFNPLRVTNGTSVMYRYGAIGTYIGSTPTFVPILGLYGQVKQPAKLQLTASSTSSVTISGTSPNFTADFGQLVTGQTPSLTFTITNTGELPTAGVPTLTLTNSTPSSYAVLGASTCTAALTPGQSCTVAVNTQPTSAIGTVVNNIVATATDASASSETSDAAYTIQARSVNAALLTITPNATAFSSSGTAIGNTDGTLLTITVVNGGSGDTNNNRQGTTALKVDLTDSTNFAVNSTGSTCLTSTAGVYYALGALTASSTALTAETCNIVIKFNPTTSGSLTTDVSVSAATGGTAIPSKITLTGKGLGDIAITPAGTSASPVAPQQFTVSYTGPSSTTTKQFVKAQLTGTNASSFAVSQDGCFGNAISGSATCTVTVIYIGTSTTAQTATLTVTDGSTNNTATTVMSAP